MKVSRRQSLETRLCFLTIGLLFVTVLGLGHFTLEQQKTLFIQEKTESFEALGKVLSIAMQPSLDSNQIDLTRKLSEQLRESNAELEYVIISGQDGRTIFADSKHKTTASNDRSGFVGQSTRRVLKLIMGATNLDTDEVYRSRWPVYLPGDESGTISIGFSMQRINTLTDEIRMTLLAWFSVALIIGIIGSLLLARTVTSQIRLLNSGATRIIQGDLTVVIPEKSGDEVGHLTKVFNEMVVRVREAQEKLEKRANTDSLTDLYNHRFFQERLAEEIKRAARHGRELSIIMLDLDHFKNFNDTYGHPAGDAALKEVAQVLKQSVRDIDVVGRYGGEEFAVIMPECGAADAVNCAERIRLGIQRHCFYGRDDSETVPMTVSIGVAHFPQHSQEREGLIFAADIALYQSKSMGRNRVTVYSGSASKGEEDTPYKFYVALHATELTTVESIAEAIDAKHGHPRHFSRSVANLAVRIAEEAGMNAEDINSLRIAALLRDVGQIGIEDTILLKDGPLTEEERKKLEAHPSLGHAIVERSPHMKAMLPGILHHHERWDGRGYPFGLSGESIPLVARVIHIADAYQAMLTDRPHRKSLSIEQVRNEIQRCSGTQFDPKLVEVLLKLIEKDQSMAA